MRVQSKGTLFHCPNAFMTSLHLVSFNGLLTLLVFLQAVIKIIFFFTKSPGFADSDKHLNSVQVIHHLPERYKILFHCA